MNPLSVSMENMTPLAPLSERIMRCTPMLSPMEKWSKFCPEGPPAHFGCACGLIVYPADYWPRPQLVKDDVIWAAAKNARIFALDAGGSDAA